MESIQHARKVKLSKRKRITCDYAFDRRHVCRNGFLFLHDLGTKQLKNIQKHLHENGPVPREHGLTSHSPATIYPYEVISDAVHFIRNHATIFGIPQPSAKVEELRLHLFFWQHRKITKLFMLSMQMCVSQRIYKCASCSINLLLEYGNNAFLILFL